MDLYIVGAVGLIVVGILAFLFYRYIGAVERAVTTLDKKLQSIEKNAELPANLDSVRHSQNENIQVAQEGGANLTPRDVREENLIPPREIQHFEEEDDEEEDGIVVDDDAITAKQEDEDEANEEEADEEEDEAPGLEELNGITMTMGNELEQEEENDVNVNGSILEMEEDINEENGPLEITPETVRRMKVNEMRQVAQELGIEDSTTLKKVSLRNAILEKLSQNNVKPEEETPEQEIENEITMLENDE